MYALFIAQNSLSWGIIFHSFPGLRKLFVSRYVRSMPGMVL